MTDGRAVANTLGYVLLFGVILLSITLTATFGLGGLTDARDGTIRTNAQQSMQTLGGAADNLRESNTTFRQTAFRTSSGTLGYGENTTVNITVGSGDPDLSTTFRPIVYQYEGTTIAYEAGAVIESSEGSGTAAMVDEPPFVIDGNTIILPIVTTEPVAEREVSGGLVTTQLRRERSVLNYNGTVTGGQELNVTIDTTPERSTAWQQTLNEDIESADPCTRTDGTVECVWTPDAQRVIVREFRISYEYSA